MARKQKAGKGRNGEGESVTVYFDKNDPQERRAMEMAKLLASKHGRRKRAIVALLDAMYGYYQETGELMTSTAIQAAISPGNVGQFAALSLPVMQPAQRSKPEPLVRRDDTQFVTVTGGGKASASQSAANFVNSMSSMSFFD
jgi:hypothetical protein